MKLITGFGNPGEKHLNSRGNIGFKIIEVIASNYGFEIKTKKKKSLIGWGEFEGEDIVLLKPQTYVNLCGESLLYIASFLKVRAPDIIVVHETLDLPLGKTRIARGNKDIDIHPGVKSVAKSLRSNNFFRIQVGIDSPYVNKKVNYLKQEFTQDESTYLIDIINDTEANLRSICLGHSDGMADYEMQ